MANEAAGKWVVSGLALALAGCQALGWSANEDQDRDPAQMGKYLGTVAGMVPVIPPTEDLRVGDIFVSTLDTEDPAQPLARIPRWDTVPLREEIAAEYADRPEFPETPEVYASLPTDVHDRSWPDAEQEGNIFTGERAVLRMRSVSLPAFSLKPEAIGESLPADMFDLGLGGSWDRWKSVSIRPATAESYSIALDTLLDVLLEEGEEEVLPEPDEEGNVGPSARRPAYYLQEAYRNNFELFRSQGVDRVWVRVNDVG